MRLEWILNWIDERAHANMPTRPAHLVARDHRVHREAVEHHRRAGSERLNEVSARLAAMLSAANVPHIRHGAIAITAAPLRWPRARFAATMHK